MNYQSYNNYQQRGQLDKPNFYKNIYLFYYEEKENLDNQRSHSSSGIDNQRNYILSLYRDRSVVFPKFVILFTVISIIILKSTATNKENTGLIIMNFVIRF